MMAAAIGMIIVALALMIFCVAVMWKVFCKAGEPGWASLIPFYNLYVMTRITWGRGWLFIFGFLPLGNLIFAIFTMIKLAKVFGKKGGFACGLIFLSIVFLPILAFGKAEYTGPDPEKSTGVIIASAITGGIGIILLVLEVIAVVALGLFAVSDLTVQQTQDAVISQEVPEETQEEPDVKEEEGVQREYEGTPIEGYEDFETVSLDGYQWVTDVTLFKAGKNTVTESTATSAKDGIELKAGFTLLAADEMIEQRISAEVQNIRKTLESQAGIYTDITVGEMVAEDGFVMQQLICNQIGADGVAYPCTEIIQVQLMEDREILVSSVSLNTSQATENTERLFTQACELYGIAFQLRSAIDRSGQKNVRFTFRKDFVTL